MIEYIACDIIGPGDGLHNFGLGNQLFNIAALISHAYGNNLAVTFPQIKTPQFGGYDKNIMSRVNNEDFPTDANFEHYVQVPYGYHELPKRGGIMYRGYFQSEKYFLHNRQLILDTLAPTEEIKSYINDKYGELLKRNLLSMHIRRGDYLHLPNYHPTVSPAYHIAATDYITSKEAVDGYVIFSDDIGWCKETFGNEQDITYIEGEEDYIDMYLMSLCKHNIIANSTFSWWGAWLNQNPSKIVVAPSQWFGPARADLDTKDLIPETWITI